MKRASFMPMSIEDEIATMAAPWFTAANAIVRTGHSCVVLDPDASGVSELWDEHPDHGTILVVPIAANGWSITVRECDPDAEDLDV